jgi:type VI secretion system protein ImpC
MIDTIQQKLGRVKPPRVHITYDVETEGAIIHKELPCTIGIIADLTGLREEKFFEYESREFISLTPSNFNDVLIKCKPKASVVISINGNNEENEICFEKIEDFEPINIINKVESLKQILNRKNRISELLVKISNSSKIFKNANDFMKTKDFDSVFKEYNFKNEEQKQNLKGLFELLSEFTEGDLQSQITKEISKLNEILSNCLNQILHNKSFQKIEATWRGLLYLIKNSEIGVSLKIYVLNATFDELEQDLTKAMEFDQSYLFKKVYEQEFGTYGGNPYSVLLIDHYIENNSMNMSFVYNLSKVVACAHLPTIVGTDPSMLDINSFEHIHEINNVGLIFQSNEFIKFRNFRNTEESRYVGFILPKFIGRLPYGPNTIPVKEINYTETIDSHNDFLWSNSVYLYGQRICDSFARFHWFASIVGPENGGMVQNLPIYSYKSSNGDVVVKCPTEIIITDRREKELSDNGFISLCYCKDQDYAVFFSGQSANKPLVYNKDNATANANLSSKLQYILNASRFAHYIKAIMRDKVGSFMNVNDVRDYLTDWISEYILLNDEPEMEEMAKTPLKGAKITVEEDLKRPGCYSAIILIQPHFQMEELTVSLRLVARLPEEI